LIVIQKLELGLTIPGPEVSPEEVASMCEFLRGKGWIRAVAIEVQTQVNDRKMRVLAEHSKGRILSGQKGYRLFDRTTPLEEADHAASWLESQGSKMIRRGAAIRRLYHRYAREPLGSLPMPFSHREATVGQPASADHGASGEITRAQD